jgi:hypothetical protein
VTTQIHKDDVSDLNEDQPFSLTSLAKIAYNCSASCALNQLVERDDFFSIAFDLLSQNVKVFSFRGGFGPCAVKLSGQRGNQAETQTYDKIDPDQFAEVKNYHFTIGKSDQKGDYCVPNGSVWEKLDCHTSNPDQVMRLRRLDKETGEVIYISTFKGWKGTLMAKKSGIIHPMACQ